MIVLILTATHPSSRRRQHVNSQLNPEDPAFKAAVIAIVDTRVHEVLTRIGTQLDRAGYTEAANFVRANFGG